MSTTSASFATSTSSTSSTMYDASEIIDSYRDKFLKNHDTHREIIARIVDNMDNKSYFRILDIGCGIAPLLFTFNQMFPDCEIDYTGIDNSDGMLENAKLIHKYNNPKLNVKFINRDITKLHEDENLLWYNIIICQNVIHLLLCDDDIANLLKFMSTSLANDGTFYISTRINVKIVNNIRDNVYMVMKNDKTMYQRRVFSEREFEKIITDGFSDKIYNFDFFKMADNTDAQFINVIGHKNTIGNYRENGFAFGFNDRFREIGTILKKGLHEYTSDLNTFEINRIEGYLMNLSQKEFMEFMDCIAEIFRKTMPGRYPVYMKDKLNMNLPGWKFPLHQDASAGWNKRLDGREFVTIAFFLDETSDMISGPTRIAISMKHKKELHKNTQSDNTVKHEERLQYLNCVGIPGSYYVFDQYIIHDSGMNNTNTKRNVFFVTFAAVYFKDDMYSLSLANLFYDTKKSLDVVHIKQLMAQGHTKDDFSIDAFGKININKIIS